MRVRASPQCRKGDPAHGWRGREQRARHTSVHRCIDMHPSALAKDKPQFDDVCALELLKKI